MSVLDNTVYCEIFLCKSNCSKFLLTPAQIHNDPDCGPSPYTCARSVSLFLPWEGEIRLQNFMVTFKGQRY